VRLINVHVKLTQSQYRALTCDVATTAWRFLDDGAWLGL
jgi:hypothetical protein